MAIRSDRTIYSILEARLKKATQPLTCGKLMEFDDVREAALKDFNTTDVRDATNKVSNAL